ncbi:MAG: hypothetical protein A4E62_01705 [Syntrophorhabdus sp. PtaU1.Bin002]|nr:MAG: hypothetical protein A4E62_01705 [Syntrophorhabdus sp. PtaU1.Bin002]
MPRGPAVSLKCHGREAAGIYDLWCNPLIFSAPLPGERVEYLLPSPGRNGQCKLLSFIAEIEQAHEVRFSCRIPNEDHHLLSGCTNIGSHSAGGTHEQRFFAKGYEISVELIENLMFPVPAEEGVNL